MIAKIALPRRTFLRGIGAVVGLPLLDSMVPAMTALAQTAAKPVRRLSFVYVPHGANQDWAPPDLRWKPPTTGTNFQFSSILKPLELVRDHVVVVSDLVRGTDIGHWNSPPGWLAGLNTVKKTEGADFYAGTTLDQIAAKHLGQSTPFPSLELGTEDFTGYIGACDVGYSCAYYNSISWSSPNTPLPMDIDPRSVFERLFGQPGTSAQRLARIHRNQSILDSITDDTNDLLRTLGPGDQRRLHDYLATVREIERRIQQVEGANQTRVTLVDAPVGIPESFADHVALLFDLLTLAYQADLTRVSTFMLCRELSQRTYKEETGLTDPHHSMSHHQNDPVKLTGLAKIQSHHVQLLSKFAEKLHATPDGDGSLLDHSLIAYGSGMGNSNGHLPDQLPLVLLGGAVGKLKGNRHVEAPPNTPLANLWLDVADKCDLPLERLGNSTGRLDV